MASSWRHTFTFLFPHKHTHKHPDHFHSAGGVCQCGMTVDLVCSMVCDRDCLSHFTVCLECLSESGGRSEGVTALICHADRLGKEKSFHHKSYLRLSMACYYGFLSHSIFILCSQSAVSSHNGLNQENVECEQSYPMERAISFWFSSWNMRLKEENQSLTLEIVPLKHCILVEPRGRKSTKIESNSLHSYLVIWSDLYEKKILYWFLWGNSGFSVLPNMWSQTSNHPVYKDRQPFIFKVNLESPSNPNLTCMSLDDERKL